MGTRLLTFQTNLDQLNTFTKIQAAGYNPVPQRLRSLKRYATHEKKEKVELLKELSGNITVDLPEYKAKVQISPEGKVNIWLPTHLTDPRATDLLLGTMKILRPLCVKENGEPCGWNFLKVTPGPAMLRELENYRAISSLEGRRKYVKLLETTRKGEEPQKNFMLFMMHFIEKYTTSWFHALKALSEIYEEFYGNPDIRSRPASETILLLKHVWLLPEERAEALRIQRIEEERKTKGYITLEQRDAAKERESYKERLRPLMKMIQRHGLEKLGTIEEKQAKAILDCYY